MTKGFYDRIYDYARARLNLDVELRYRSVARLIRPEIGKRNTILEVGAGAVSLGAYLGCCSTAVDAIFDSPPDQHTDRVRALAHQLPFRDKSWDVVVSIDMLEHISPETRDKVIWELTRVAKRLVVIAAPTGEPAFKHDLEVHNYYLKKYARPHRFTGEHIKFGLPSVTQTGDSMRSAAHSNGRVLELEMQPNVNIRFRSWYMKLAFHSSVIARALYVAIFPLSAFAALYDRGTCYRAILLGRLKESPISPAGMKFEENRNYL